MVPRLSLIFATFPHGLCCRFIQNVKEKKQRWDMFVSGIGTAWRWELHIHPVLTPQIEECLTMQAKNVSQRAMRIHPGHFPQRTSF